MSHPHHPFPRRYAGLHGLHGLHGGKKRLNKHIFHAISRHIFFIYFSQKPARLPPSLVPPEVCRSAWSAWSAWWQKEAKTSTFSTPFSRHAFFIYFSQKPARLPPSPAPPKVCRSAWSACLERQHSFRTSMTERRAATQTNHMPALGSYSLVFSKCSFNIPQCTLYSNP